MGLAPYGNPSSEQTLTYIKTIKDKLITIKLDGSIYLNQEYFNYATGLKMINVEAWEKLFSFPIKNDNFELKQHHCNLALAIQTVTEEIVLKMANTARLITGSNNLCLAGGVALNCVSNSKILNSSLFKDIFIQPAAGDAGGALGAALAVNYMYFNNERKPTINYMQGTYLGPFYSNKEIERMNRKFNAVVKYFTSEKKLSIEVAKLLSCGNVIGWFQGKMEYGPRALGNRSILADAQSIDMQKVVNDKIKFRESFRPFAPVVIKEDVLKYFNHITESEFMLYVASVNDAIKKELPENYLNFSMQEKLSVERSEIQAVTHVDFSARLQTVTEESNKKLWALIKDFKDLTGCSVLINTSFNVRSEPIVCTPEDAYRCFMETNMDFLVINNWLYKKTNQANWENKLVWKRNFNKD
ncbi:UNVERIFIED_CONTAM: hypothetical protein GTU68_014410 [Idotea baltica]|nr:hypothetical protein [Idotea baltica]